MLLIWRVAVVTFALFLGYSTAEFVMEPFISQLQYPVLADDGSLIYIGCSYYGSTCALVKLNSSTLAVIKEKFDLILGVPTWMSVVDHYVVVWSASCLWVATSLLRIRTRSSSVFSVFETGNLTDVIPAAECQNICDAKLVTEPHLIDGAIEILAVRSIFPSSSLFRRARHGDPLKHTYGCSYSGGADVP